MSAYEITLRNKHEKDAVPFTRIFKGQRGYVERLVERFYVRHFIIIRYRKVS